MAALLAAGGAGRAQDSGKPSMPPANPPAASASSAAAAASGAKPAASAASATMQIRRDIAGNFLCRFITKTDETAPLVALPAPLGTDNVVAVPIPATLKAQAAQLEIVDADHSRIARLPVGASGVTPLNDSSFGFVQTVLVPVVVRGKGGLTSATVTLASGDKGYSKSVLLTPADAGSAHFSNVPLNKPVTVTVQEGTNAPVSVTQTLTTPPTADGFKFTPIEVSWPDAKTVPLPAGATAAAPAPGTPPLPPNAAVGMPPAAYPAGGYPAAPPLPYPPVVNNTDSPFSGVLSTIVSLLFLGGAGYGLYWAYQNGHLKTLLDKLGIQTQPPALSGPQPSPFDKAQRAPVQPITEGTADPLHGFAGGAANAGGFTSAPAVSSGPRLVGTMGTYAGQIFPLSGTALDIGRDAANPIALPDDTNASRRHAILQLTGGQAMVTDNGSSNGTFVNGVRIAAQTPHPLQSGDEVQIGMTRFRFEQ